ncbi:MAG: YgiT-type zinc finger protein [bacterium]
MNNQCPVCGGEIVRKKVEKILKGGENTAVIEVDAEVCLRCGERLYDEETIRKFEKIRAKLSEGEVTGLKPVGKVYRVA